MEVRLQALGSPNKLLLYEASLLQVVACLFHVMTCCYMLLLVCYMLQVTVKFLCCCSAIMNRLGSRQYSMKAFVSTIDAKQSMRKTACCSGADAPAWCAIAHKYGNST